MLIWALYPSSPSIAEAIAAFDTVP